MTEVRLTSLQIDALKQISDHVKSVQEVDSVVLTLQYAQGDDKAFGLKVALDD